MSAIGIGFAIGLAVVLLLGGICGSILVRLFFAGVEASLFLRMILLVAAVFMTQNARHAHALGDRFTVLNRGASPGTFTKTDIALDDLQALMGGAPAPGADTN